MSETTLSPSISISMSENFIECYNRALARETEFDKIREDHIGGPVLAPEDAAPSLLQPQSHSSENGKLSWLSAHGEVTRTSSGTYLQRDKDSSPVSVQPFRAIDLLNFSKVNFDPLTETYGLTFYMTYLARWPEYFQKLVDTSGRIIGYIMGKSEGHDENWHGHVTCLSVDRNYRGQGLAGMLMKYLEDISEAKKTYFVDLFVRKSNEPAIRMYKKLGYVVYRTVLGYYSGSVEQGYKDEDAYDMRKAMSRDVERKSVIPLAHPVRPEDLD